MKMERKTISLATIAVLILATFSSCMPSVDDLEMQESAKIQQYLNDNPTLHFEHKESGLYYLEVKTGTGLPATTHDTGYVFCTFKTLGGNELDSNVGTTDTLIFPINEDVLIEGFDEGVTYMKAGGNSILLVPSKLGYGPTGDYYFVAGYTPLIIDVTLVRVKPGSGKK
jgi:FKBP-type peptidyl-prolyl cis-trans isomerase FkpA